MNKSCHAEVPQHSGQPTSARKADWLLRVSMTLVVSLYLLHWQFAETLPAIMWLHELSHAVFELMNTIWWGILLGVLMIAALGRVPREFVISALGSGGSVWSIGRATILGALLDLCSHGILMVGARLYERGASIGQVMAFLIASPWNSFSLTLILIALIGVFWTLMFILLSMVIAVISGLIFDRLVYRNVLPVNPQHTTLPDNFDFWPEAKQQLASADLSGAALFSMLVDGIKGSRMVLRWMLFGVLLASLLRVLIPPNLFATLFGPSLMGLGITIVAATVIEVCSEGSTPIAADILTRANAPGNSFAFLMGGVSTDYTEILVLKEVTKSWKIALYLPLITLPQIIALGWLLNTFAR